MGRLQPTAASAEDILVDQALAGHEATFLTLGCQGEVEMT